MKEWTDPFGIQILYLIIIAASKQRIFSSQFLIMTGEMRGRVCVVKKLVCQKSKENSVLLSVHTKSAVKLPILSFITAQFRDAWSKFTKQLKEIQ